MIAQRVRCEVGYAEFSDINRLINAIGEAMGQKVGCHSVSGLQQPEFSPRTDGWAPLYHSDPRDHPQAHINDRSPGRSDGPHVLLQLAPILRAVLRRGGDVRFPVDHH